MVDTHTKVKLVGLRPLLMHSPRSVDWLDPLTKQLDLAVREHKKSKTEHTEIAKSKAEFAVGMYYDEELGPYIPVEVIHACLVEAAKNVSKGKHVERGVLIESEDEVGFPLSYEGPRDIDELFAQGFYDRRRVVVQQNSIMRTRPKFDDWGIEDVEISYNSKIIGDDMMQTILDLAGMTGLCDYRQRFGKFTYETY